MKNNNPYAISFGRIPHQYISRDVLLTNITDALDSEFTNAQAFKLTGIRGTGKTVMLSAIEKQLRTQSRWIICDIRPGGNIMEDIVSQLYNEVPFLKEYIDTDINLSAFGLGISVHNNKPAHSLDFMIKKILEEVSRRKKRVLITIDEVRKTDAIVDFIQEFQILIRQDLPIYLIIAGLYEDIESIENTDGLTFFLRAEKCEMIPLNITLIREDYKKTMELDHETAARLAEMTKGYAFAYQAFGKYMWESEDKSINDTLLAQVDEALALQVYNKIWSELSPQEKWFMSFIAKKESMSVDELLSVTQKKHAEWSKPRAKLIEKGILDCRIRGRISVKLPRFREYLETHMEQD